VSRGQYDVPQDPFPFEKICPFIQDLDKGASRQYFGVLSNVLSPLASPKFSNKRRC
jgi:hypothetical protein